MKKLSIFAMTLMLVLNVFYTSAKIWRVGYPGNQLSGTDYAGNYQGLINAIAGSSAGDTILLFPGYYYSPNSNYNIYVNKKIVMLSYGYFVNVKQDSTKANANLQNISGAMYVVIWLTAGSDSSIFKGIDGLNIGPEGNTIKNIIINRCNITNLESNGGTYQNWQITQCYVNSCVGNPNPNYGGGLYSNLLFSNCYIHNVDFSNFTSGGSLNGEFINNIFDGGCNFNNGAFLIKNNIFLAASMSNSSGCTFSYNISTQADIPSGNGDKQNVSSSGIFVGYPTQGTYSNDALWALAASSPAKAAGEGGTDCGIFGGTNPYVLSGIPNIPAFYQLTAPSPNTSGNPYTITFSVRSNN